MGYIFSETQTSFTMKWKTALKIHTRGYPRSLNLPNILWAILLILKTKLTYFHEQVHSSNINNNKCKCQPSQANFSGLSRTDQGLGTCSPGRISTNCRLLLAACSFCLHDPLFPPLLSSVSCAPHDGGRTPKERRGERPFIHSKLLMHSFIHSKKHVLNT